jgi:hypothetical protein
MVLQVPDQVLLLLVFAFAPMQELKQTMAGLLRLHMSLQNEAQGDEQVRAGATPASMHSNK